MCSWLVVVVVILLLFSLCFEKGKPFIFSDLARFTGSSTPLSSWVGRNLFPFLNWRYLCIMPALVIPGLLDSFLSLS